MDMPVLHSNDFIEFDGHEMRILQAIYNIEEERMDYIADAGGHYQHLSECEGFKHFGSLGFAA